MLKTFNKARVRCPMVFYEDKAVFKTKNYPKDDKISKNFRFLTFFAIFVIFSTDFVDRNLEKSQQGTNLILRFRIEKYLKLAPK